MKRARGKKNIVAQPNPNLLQATNFMVHKVEPHGSVYIYIFWENLKRSPRFCSLKFS